jgi:phage shock protein PspC (stress-responsive transcriptional regulator)
MQKVVTINLNGNAYQIDERGYDALVAYLADAERKLAGSPDRAEILADLEQAIADKCRLVLGPNKTVVTAAEVERIVGEMGPVEAPGAEPAGAAGANATSDAGDARDPRQKSGAPRRLYLIKDGAMVGGVCAGLAAYVGIDPTIVRILFVLLTLLTKGLWALAYMILLIVIPTANTSEEQAAARGEPFNAQELIDRAKRHYAGFKNQQKDHDRASRRQRREWRRHVRYAAHAGRWGFPPFTMSPPMAAMPPVGYATRIGAGLMIPVLAFASAACFWIFAYAAMSFFVRQQAFGVSLPAEMPIWVGLLILSIVYAVVAGPVHALRRASYYAVGYPYGLAAAWGGLMSMAFGVLIVWLGYRNSPDVRVMVRSLPMVWDAVLGLVH